MPIGESCGDDGGLHAESTKCALWLSAPWPCPALLANQQRSPPPRSPQLCVGTRRLGAARDPPPAPRSKKAERVKLADEPLAPKKKTKSKVKLAAKANLRRSVFWDGDVDDAGLLGLALRPGLLAVPEEEKSTCLSPTT